MEDEETINLIEPKKVIRPAGTGVLVGEIGQLHEETLKSGLVLPAIEAQRKGLVKALVIAVGADVRHTEPEQTVYFIETVAFEIAGKTIIQERDIMAYEDDEE